MLALDRPIVAYRCWQARRDIAGDERGLFSLVTKTLWTPGENVAQCLPPLWMVQLPTCTMHSEPSPMPKCLCGLHGNPRSEDVMRWAGPIPQMVWGAILMWGTMFSGGTAIRASNAEVVVLVENRNIQGLAEVYQVPVVPEAGLSYYATEQYDELTDEQIEELKRRD